MFFSKIVAVFAVAVATVSVGARPLPLPLQKASLATRGEQVVRNMEQVVGPVTIIEKRQANVNKVPAEIPTQSKNGVIEPFQGGDVTKRQTSVQDAVMSDGSEIVPFKNTGKRDVVPEAEVEAPVVEKRQTSVQDAVMSDGGEIVPFKNTGKRDVVPEAEVEAPVVEKRQTSVQDAVMSDGGEIVPFKNTGKRDVVPEAEAEAPVVEKRQPKINTFPTWVAARSDGGEIVAF